MSRARVRIPRWLVASAWVLTMCCAFSAARAHSTSTSYLELTRAEEEGKYDLRWDVAARELADAVDLDTNLDGDITWGDIADAEPGIARLLIGGITVAAGGDACAVRMSDLALATRLDEPFISTILRVQCARADALSVTPALFFRDDAAQRALLRATLGANTFAAALSPSSPTWQQPASPSALRSFGAFVVQGYWHVLIGYDHIVFLLLLLLPAVLTAKSGAWRAAASRRAVLLDIVRIVTAFTLAHSTTLGLATAQWVTLPARPVELAIAATILLTGIANLVPAMHRARLPIAFGFGLVHGFGFANALSELEPSGAALLPLLGGFNIGVELAQLSIVAILLPVLLSARHTEWYPRRAMPAASCALGLLGAWWLWSRLP
jgi:HupE / UreJ protein